MDERQRRQVLKKSQRQERRTAQSLGAKQHAGSGNKWLHKNDSRTPRLLIENKTVAGDKQITIKGAELEGVRRHAAREGLDPVLSFELNGRDYDIVEHEYVLDCERLRDECDGD